MKNVLIFTGAGISAESGVPTFEDLGDKFREGLSRSRFKKDPEGLYNDLLMMKEACDKALPNPAHEIIAKHQIHTITMNIDGLHTRAGLDKSKLIEIHGSIEKVYCFPCDGNMEASVFPIELVKENIHCPYCERVLQPQVVLYEDDIPLMDKAIEWVKKCEVLVVVGTSFYTSTSSIIYEEAMRRGKDVHIINEKASINLPRLLERL